MYKNYPSAFPPASFYYLPTRWLNDVDTSFLLDLMDVLLLRVEDEYDGYAPLDNPYAEFGHINFSTDSGYDEHIWSQSDGDLPALFSQNTYRKYKSILLATGLLRDPLTELFALSVAFNLLVQRDNEWYYWHSKSDAWRSFIPAPVTQKASSIQTEQVNLAAALTKFTSKDAHWSAVRRKYMGDLQERLTAEPVSPNRDTLHAAFEPYLAQLHTWENGLLDQDADDFTLSPRERENQRMAVVIQRAAIQNVLTTLPRLTPAIYFAQMGKNYTYWLANWPHMGALFYRPRAYVERRWPTAWLDPKPPNNGRNLGSRVALIALLILLKEQTADRVNSGRGGPPQQTAIEISCEIEQLYQIAERHLAHLPLQADLKSILEEAMTHLTALGVVQPSERRRYKFSPAALEQLPTWPLAGLADACDVDLILELPWLELLRAYGVKGLLNVNHLPKEWKQKVVNRRTQSTLLLTAEDAAQFTQHIYQQDHERLIADPFPGYEKRERIKHLRIVGDSFTLAHTAAAWLSDVQYMPQHPGYAQPHMKPSSIRTTQLLLTIHSGSADFGTLSDSTLQHICAEVQESHFVFLQGIAQEEGKTYRVDWPQLTKQHLLYGLIIDASHLQGKLRYDQPFLVMLTNLTMSIELAFTCRLRLLFPNTGRAGARKR